MRVSCLFTGKGRKCLKSKTFEKPKKAKDFVLYEFLLSYLRRSFKELPEYKQVKDNAKREYFIDSKHGKPMRRVHFECAECHRCFTGGGKKIEKELPDGTIKKVKEKSEIAVDHIKPVIDPDVGYVDMNTLIDRMFRMGVEGLQILCNYPKERDGRRSCHYFKTQDERKRLKATKARLAAKGNTAKTAKER